jgi:hypothetical protein
MGALKTYGTSRGLRNHNPTNQRILPNKQTWDGQAQGPAGIDNSKGGPFCIFEDFNGKEADFWGLRAGAKNFRSYQTVDGCDTFTKIINRHAPPTDSNDTTSYIAFVCSSIKASPNAIVDLSKNIPLFLSFMKFICKEEEGIDPYPDTLILAAIQDALGIVAEIATSAPVLPIIPSVPTPTPKESVLQEIEDDLKKL